MNYYRFHIGDYAAATEHLSWDEDLAYRRLLSVYYRDERPIPADLRLAYRLVRATTPEQREAVETVLKEFFTESPDGWRHKRCDAEIEEHQQYVERQRASGRASAAKRSPNGGSETLHNGGSTTVDGDGNDRSTTVAQEGNDRSTRTLRLVQPPTPTPTPISVLRTSPEAAVAALPLPEPEQPPPAADPPRRPPRPKLAASHTVPPDFVPDLAYARAAAPDFDAEAEAERFRLWEFREPKRDWNLAWKRWVREAVARGNYARQRPAPAAPIVAAAAVTSDGRPPVYR